MTEKERRRSRVERGVSPAQRTTRSANKARIAKRPGKGAPPGLEEGAMTPSYRKTGRRYVAVIRYPNGAVRTVGKRRYFNPEDARAAAAVHIEYLNGIYGQGAAMRIDNYEGERVEVEDQSTAELQRIRAEILDDMVRGSLTPLFLLEESLDAINEELEGRS